MSIGTNACKENATRKPEVIIRGWLKGPFKKNHHMPDGAVIYENYICTVNTLGQAKVYIPTQITEQFLNKIGNNFDEDEFVELHGEFRTKNVYDNEGNKIQRRCYVFVKSIESIDEKQMSPQNYVRVSGVLARKGKIHHCKNGDSMFDFTLDIRRSYGRRSSIPCVIWGKERTQFLAKVCKNSNVEVEGWIKTRVITDSLGITKAVNEIIVDEFYVYD